jgi:hypothetical protein
LRRSSKTAVVSIPIRASGSDLIRSTASRAIILNASMYSATTAAWRRLTCSVVSSWRQVRPSRRRTANDYRHSGARHRLQRPLDGSQASALGHRRRCEGPGNDRSWASLRGLEGPPRLAGRRGAGNAAPGRRRGRPRVGRRGIGIVRRSGGLGWLPVTADQSPGQPIAGGAFMSRSRCRRRQRRNDGRMAVGP